MLIQSTLSQYALGAVGTSACTAIAAAAAATLLPLLDSGNPTPPHVLDSIVTEGVQIASLGEGNHLDFATAFMLSGLDTVLRPLNLGAEAQGLLTTPNSLEDMCREARAQASSAPPRPYLAIVLTKPPETICIFLPPPAGGRFLLFDSHPRPGVPNASLYEAPSLQALLQRVREVFPPLPTEAGDEENMVLMMYNTFDGTFLQAVAEPPPMEGGAAP